MTFNGFSPLMHMFFFSILKVTFSYQEQIIFNFFIFFICIKKFKNINELE